MKISRLTQRFVRSLLRAFAAVAIVAKLLVPAGYMPGSLAAGLPVQLCDAGFAPVVLHAHAHEHAGHDAHAAHAQGDGTQHGHDAAGELHWKYCPSGALAAAGAIPVEHRLDLEPVTAHRFIPNDTASVVRTPFIPFRSRAPPLALANV